jgi:GT2 family glycosyltransferase
VPPTVTIVVPTRRVDDYTRECVRECRRLDYPSFEVLVVTDREEPAPEGARVLASGPVPPGVKRNLAARHATGDVLAFIDSDAYPRPDWLRNAVRALEAGAGAVGGPGVTPPHDPPLAQVSGLILGSPLMGGRLSARYADDDIHSCNFVAWRKVVEEAGGWSERYWPGEDTLLCRAIKLNGHRQVFSPEVVVFHHRRASWRAHVRQIWNYAVHRGFFAKRFPETSRRPAFFAPSVLVLGVASGPLLALAWPPLWVAYGAGLAGYLAAGAWAALKSPKYRLPVFAGILLTHAVYGVGVLVGLSSPRLKR